MTTNHFSRLDPALIRPGRVDVQELLDDAVGEQAERLFTKFYGASEDRGEVGVKAEMGSEVGRVVEEERARGRGISMASLQGLFIRHGPRESVSEVKELCKPADADG